MICRNGDCTHEGRPYAYAIGHRTTVLCDGCSTSLRAAGMDLRLVERRVADLPVLVERRHFGPRWLAHLRSRDETGRLVA